MRGGQLGNIATVYLNFCCDIFTLLDREYKFQCQFQNWRTTKKLSSRIPEYEPRFQAVAEADQVDRYVETVVFMIMATDNLGWHQKECTIISTS